MPPQTVQRYLVDKTKSSYGVWRFNHKIRCLPVGKTLRIEVLAPAVVHWSDDDWRTAHDIATRDSGLAIHVVDLPTAALVAGKRVKFTIYWPQAAHWEGADFVVEVDSGAKTG